ncbi:MAG TPA: hypothetical protein VK733_05685 [Gemmatimonadaceae bacterium]|nr:hypothetical protein [Gemmatimonadaceae bacterium]
MLGLLLVASPLAAQGRTPDLAGTWTLNATKSHSSQPLPLGRTLVIERAPNGYVFHQVDGSDSATFRISLAGAGASVNQSDGASAVRYTAHMAADTIVYVVDVTVDNQGLAATQSGRLWMSNGGRMLTDLSELVAGGDPVEQQLVYDKKR